MQLVINITKWPNESPLEHVHTDIIIKDEDDNLVFPEERIYTNVWVKDIDIPVGITYYVTERKNFLVKGVPESDQQLSFESVVHTITNNDTEISNMLLKEYVEIEKPTLYLKLKDVESNANDITIKGSSYRGKGDGHTHSHWIIKADGVIKYKSLRDQVNKTSLLVNREDISFSNKLEVYLTYCSNNIESETLVHTIRKKDVNFRITSNLINVPLEDYNLQISKIDQDSLMRLAKVNLMQGDYIIKTYEITSDSYNVSLTIPKNYIVPNGVLIIELYGYDNDDKLTKTKHKLVPYNLPYEDNINKDFEYKKVFNHNIYNTTLPKGLVTDTIYNSILVPDEEGFKLRKHAPDIGILTSGNIPGLNHLGNIENMLVRINNNNTILIDCLNNNNQPTFLVYKYVTLNNINSYVLVNSLVRPDEVVTTAFNNSIEQINNDEFIYNIHGTDKLVKYNMVTNTITVLKDIGVENTTSITIVKMDDNQLLCFPNGNTRTRIYLIKENKFIDGMLINYNEYHGSNLKKVDLVNGDKLLFKNTEEVNHSSILYFDISEYTLTEIDYTIGNSNNNIIVRENNVVFIGSIIDKDYINYQQDRLELISFN